MHSSRSFFDPTLVEKWGAAFIREDKVDEALGRLIPNVRVTKGGFTCPGYAEPRDLLWNHMDQNHRPHIHRTYGEAMRIFIGERGAFSLTRFGGWPAVIPVFDGHFKDNGLYQVMCLFGLIVIINTIECHVTDGATRMEINWAIASHRFLKFLHPMLDRRLQRLNVIQNKEDEVIRKRRVEMRAQGYRFATDDADFVNSNAMANNVVFPPLATPFSVALADLPEGKPERIDIGDRAFVVRRMNDSLDVWPGVCPHEGAVLEPGDVRGNNLKCSWHGLEYGPRRLAPGGSAIVICGARLSMSDGRLDIVSTAKEPS
jgi:Rieske [2Fe-2S] domain